MKGFTLIETVLVISMSAAMMLAISVLVFNFNNISAYDSASAKSSSSARALMREIVSLASQADAVLASHDFSGSARASSAAVLVLELPSVDASGNVLDGAHDYAAFYSDGTDAYRVLEADAASARAGETKKLSSTVSSMNFSYDNAAFPAVSAVTADISVQAQVKQEIISGHLREQVRLRNHL